MTPEETITTLKAQYDRNLRKQLVKSLLEDETKKHTNTQTQHLINQIFSYVLKDSNWNLTHNSSEWDTQPLEIMKKVFPKIETTMWYKDKNLAIDKDIDVVVGS